MNMALDTSKSDFGSQYWLVYYYYKMRQILLQYATAIFTTKCDQCLLQNASVFLLQKASGSITNCNTYYEVR